MDIVRIGAFSYFVPDAITLESWKTNSFEYEDHFQKASIDMIDKYFPPFRSKRWHTQNELHIVKLVNESPKQYENRCKQIGAQNKAKGKLEGFPDIGIKHQGVLFTNELKQPDGTVSKAQHDLHLVFGLDYPEIPTFVSYNLYQVYQWCVWILKSNFKVVKGG